MSKRRFEFFKDTLGSVESSSTNSNNTLAKKQEELVRALTGYTEVLVRQERAASMILSRNSNSQEKQLIEDGHKRIKVVTSGVSSISKNPDFKLEQVEQVKQERPKVKIQQDELASSESETSTSISGMRQ